MSTIEGHSQFQDGTIISERIDPSPAPALSSDFTMNMVPKTTSKDGGSRISTTSIASGTVPDSFKRVTQDKIIAYGYQNKLGLKIKSPYDLLGFEEIWNLHLYRQLLTECFGTFALLTLGCCAVTPHQVHHEGDAVSIYLSI